MEWKLTYSRRQKKKKKEKKEILNLFYQPPFEDLGLEAFCNGRPSCPQLALRDISKGVAKRHGLWELTHTHTPVRAQTFHSVLDTPLPRDTDASSLLQDWLSSWMRELQPASPNLLCVSLLLYCSQVCICLWCQEGGLCSGKHCPLTLSSSRVGHPVS